MKKISSFEYVTFLAEQYSLSTTSANKHILFGNPFSVIFISRSERQSEFKKKLIEFSCTIIKFLCGSSQRTRTMSPLLQEEKVSRLCKTVLVLFGILSFNEVDEDAISRDDARCRLRSGLVDASTRDGTSETIDTDETVISFSRLPTVFVELTISIVRSRSFSRSDAVKKTNNGFCYSIMINDLIFLI